MRDNIMRRQKEHKIFVKNLPLQINDEKLAEMFKKYGEIKKAYIIYHYNTSISKRYGYVEFLDKESADKASKKSKFKCQGRMILVSKFVPRSEQDDSFKMNSKGFDMNQMEEMNKCVNANFYDYLQFIQNFNQQDLCGNKEMEITPDSTQVDESDEQCYKNAICYNGAQNQDSDTNTWNQNSSYKKLQPNNSHIPNDQSYYNQNYNFNTGQFNNQNNNRVPNVSDYQQGQFYGQETVTNHQIYPSDSVNYNSNTYNCDKYQNDCNYYQENSTNSQLEPLNGYSQNYNNDYVNFNSVSSNNYYTDLQTNTNRPENYNYQNEHTVQNQIHDQQLHMNDGTYQSNEQYPKYNASSYDVNYNNNY